MKIKLDADGNVVLDEHKNPVLVDDDGKEVSTFTADYVKTLRDEAKNYRLEKNTLKSELDAMKAKLDSFDPEEFERIKKEKEDAENKKLEDEKNFTALKDRLLSEHKKEIDRHSTEKEDLMKKLNQLEAEYHNTLIMTEVTRAAQEAEAFSPVDIFNRIKDSAKVVADEYGKKVVQLFDGEHPVVDGSGKPVSVKSMVSEMRSNTDTAHLFKGNNYGGGSRTDGVGKPGENPWKTGNLTLQGQMYKNDPALAKRLAGEAGMRIME